MKKYIALFLTLLMLLCLCACEKNQAPSNNDPVSTPSTTEHTHTYTQEVVAPDCTKGGYTLHTCSCGDSYQSDKIDALGHTWSDATCVTPKTCSVCNAVEGEVAPHNYQNGKCTVCDNPDPDYKTLKSGSWICHKATPSPMPMMGPGMSQYKLSFGSEKMWGFRFYEALEEPDEALMEDWIASGALLQLDGKYYLWQGMADMGEFKLSESGNKITVNAGDWGFTIVLERISGNQLKVTSLKGQAGTFMPKLAVGDVFTWAE